MGCCCTKQKEDDENYDERSRLLGTTDINQKSRFVDQASSQGNQNGMSQLNPNYQRNALSNANNMDNLGSLNQMNNSGYQNYNGGNNPNGADGNQGDGINGTKENNQMFEKIQRDVIHVSAFDQRSFLNADMTNHPVQEMPFKMKGLLEPNKQQLQLPDGVPAPLCVLAAQPPFTNDIRLINSIAQDAQMCINGYTLQIPENVAFDFNPIA